VLGRAVRTADVPWLDGPVGGSWIGDTPYDAWAARIGATVHRRAASGGLIEDLGATVILVPRQNAAGELELSSGGRGLGDVGFYRVQHLGGERLRVWRVRTLHESFRLRAEADGVLRCDHRIRFPGLPVPHLHYRIRVARGGVRRRARASPARHRARCTRPNAVQTPSSRNSTSIGPSESRTSCATGKWARSVARCDSRHCSNV
jgi:hypothetical protein